MNSESPLFFVFVVAGMSKILLVCVCVKFQNKYMLDEIQELRCDTVKWWLPRWY